MNENGKREADVNQLVHDARNSLNRISMQAELAKMLVEQANVADRAIAIKIYTALDKALVSCNECSDQLSDITAIK